MTDTTTEAVERLTECATKAPWWHDNNEGYGASNIWVEVTGDTHGKELLATIVGDSAEADANAAFIAASRDLVPALLADRDRLAAQCDSLKAQLATMAVGYTITTNIPTNCRNWEYYPIEMPSNAEGEGPCTIEEAVKVSYEVWDRTYSSHGAFDKLPDAINHSLKLCAFAASQSPDPVTNADSCQPFPKPQRNDGGQPCGECRLPDGEVCDICGASNQLTQPTRTYEDGVRDAAAVADSYSRQPATGNNDHDAGWDNAAKCIRHVILKLIKEKSHE